MRLGLQSNQYALWYSIWIVVGQMTGVAMGQIGVGSLALAAAYTVTAFIGFYVIPAFLSSPDRVDKVLRTVLYIGVVVSLSGLFANLTGARGLAGIPLRTEGSVPLLPLPASSGFLHEFNIYGLTAGLGFWGACYFLVQKKELSHIVAAGICMLAVFFSGSRAIYLAIGLGLAILIKPFKTRLSSRIAFGLATVGGVALGLFVAFGTEWGAQLLGTDAGLNRALAGRAILWPAAVLAIINRPLFGYGFESSTGQEAILDHGAAILYDNPVPAHNAFLDISLRGGVLLALLYLAAIWRSIQRVRSVNGRTYEQKMRSRILIIILLTVFIASIFMPHSLGGVGYVALVLTTFAGMSNLWPELQKQRPEPTHS
jgi:O-antigen ligase